ncbi:hypothetical protein [Leeuwenhoekiella sp. LLG6367-2.1]|uniref:hypothetical protein n=1 Tax=Leeuwenhoekiella sp. LLG6367-2.1 TaxID=3160833 RepID=UPI0038672E44
MTHTQIAFLKSELWILAFGGALQRSGVYLNAYAEEKERNTFRTNMRKFIEQQIIPQYKKDIVKDANHLKILMQ